MFKRLSAAAILLLALSAPAFASSCLLAEYRFALNGGMQIGKLKPLRTPQNITTSGTSAQATALLADTKTIYVYCDTQSGVEQGSNPTASATTSVPLPAGGSMFWDVTDQATDGNIIAFIVRP